MLRSLLLAIFLSCLAGIPLGLGTAYSFLSANAWRLDLELNSTEFLANTVRNPMPHSDARAFIEETNHFFEMMNAKEEGSHDFFIKNIGTADLILTAERITCSCLGIEITPPRVQPGQTARCRLLYTAEQAVTGRFQQGGYVVTNDPENREIYLSIEGVFTDPVAMSPASINFSRVPTGTTQTRTIRFYGFENETLQLSAPVWEDREHFAIDFQPGELTEADKQDTHLSFAQSVVEGTITLKPGLPAGNFQEWVSVQTNYTTQPNLNFVVNGQIVSGNLAINGQGYNRATGVANLGDTAFGQGSPVRSFVITFSGATALSTSIQINSIVPDWLNADISLPTDMPGSRRYSLTIEIPEDAPTGSYGFATDVHQSPLQPQIILETNDETTPLIRIPLQFRVRR